MSRSSAADNVEVVETWVLDRKQGTARQKTPGKASPIGASLPPSPKGSPIGASSPPPSPTKRRTSIPRTVPDSVRDAGRRLTQATSEAEISTERSAAYGNLLRGDLAVSPAIRRPPTGSAERRPPPAATRDTSAERRPPAATRDTSAERRPPPSSTSRPPPTGSAERRPPPPSMRDTSAERRPPPPSTSRPPAARDTSAERRPPPPSTSRQPPPGTSSERRPPPPASSRQPPPVSNRQPPPPVSNRPPSRDTSAERRVIPEGVRFAKGDSTGRGEAVRSKFRTLQTEEDDETEPVIITSPASNIPAVPRDAGKREKTRADPLSRGSGALRSKVEEGSSSINAARFKRDAERRIADRR